MPTNKEKIFPSKYHTLCEVVKKVNKNLTKNKILAEKKTRLIKNDRDVIMRYFPEARDI